MSKLEAATGSSFGHRRRPANGLRVAATDARLRPNYGWLLRRLIEPIRQMQERQLDRSDIRQWMIAVRSAESRPILGV
jgi:hypothetical protein